MDRIRSKKQVLVFICGLLAPLLVAGCGTLSTPAEHQIAHEDSDSSAGATPTPPRSVNPERASAKEAANSTPNEDDADIRLASLWARIRTGFSTNKLDSPLIDQHIRWFANNTEYMERMIERAKLYLYYIVEEVEKRGMPMEIALLPAIESAYKPYAYSRARAMGLWQFIPSTGRLYGLKANWWYDGRRDVMASTKAALDYLQKLHNDFDGDWHLALAAYNAGEGRIGRAVEYNRRKGLPTTFEHLRLIKPETKHYVPKLMAMVFIVSDPAKYGVVLAEIPNEPYFIQVETGSQIDLGVVAKLTGMKVDELHSINPGYTRWATDPSGPHHLLIPVQKREALIAGLSTLPEKDRLQWQHHEVRRGETLASISRRYGVSVQTIKESNKLTTNSLRTGQDLLLPLSGRTLTPVLAGGGKAVRAAATRGREPIVHRVRSGETLWGIARRYNVLVGQLAEWNLMKPGDILRLGQKLKVWVAPGQSASSLPDAMLITAPTA